jgi:hypothetical protein
VIADVAGLFSLKLWGGGVGIVCAGGCPGHAALLRGWGDFRWIKAGSLLACYGCYCKDNVPSCPAFIQVNPLNLSELPLPDDARQRVLFDWGWPFLLACCALVSEGGW